MRLKHFDYRSGALYFVTICTRDRACVLGEAREGELALNAQGELVDTCWEETPAHFPQVSLDSWVVMPNHLHGLLLIDETVTSVDEPRQFGRAQRGALGTVIGAFKGSCSRLARQQGLWRAEPLWQANYHEHIVRGVRDLEGIRVYVEGNPAQWSLDRENPCRFGENAADQGFGFRRQ